VGPIDWGASGREGTNELVGTRGFLAPVAQVGFRTGWAFRDRFADEGADENAKLTDCYYEKKDWRVCKKEVR
jgi:hypothetical protein